MGYIIAALGGPKVVAAEPATAGEWVSRIESGLPAASALAFKETLGLTNVELAALLGVSVRTLARWDPAKSRLDLVSGDRLVRSARLFAIAADVLEDRDAAARWMKTPQRALAGAVPLHLAETDVGTRAVEALLGRMEHGVYT
ncbi:MAG TPA: antitoxin Xre/MbcA/ParS toxin-binding domain-containing protein [Usitatibacter sp.]|nr:antitoxin Xre/MbcA/ParS toxin-binding domain-containing protein [Usitatibacter sp.]